MVNYIDSGDNTDQSKLISDGDWHSVDLINIIPNNTIEIVLSISMLTQDENVRGEFRGCSNSLMSKVVMYAGPYYPHPGRMDCILPIDSSKLIYYKIPPAKYRVLGIAIKGFIVDQEIKPRPKPVMEQLQKACYER